MDAVTTQVYPAGLLNTLSHKEVKRLQYASAGELKELLRRCALAVLTSGSLSDDAEAMLALYRDFEIEVIHTNRGIRLDMKNAPGIAFVDGKIIEGVRELLSSVLRDIVYHDIELSEAAGYDASDSECVTSVVFEILRNADALIPNTDPNLVVCWGGHSIKRGEYDYTKVCGYEMGLRGLNICTGCGPGAMKGPMKGATISHGKQRLAPGRYIGITEPGIIAAESPNPTVNELIIMPDIEKRLEAFVRLGHGIVIFPGGVGTAEEILYLLGILMHPENAEIPFPLVLSGPASAAAYFEQIDEFIVHALGEETRKYYEIIIDDPQATAVAMYQGIKKVKAYRRKRGGAYYFNWGLHIDADFQQPFIPDHKHMAALDLSRDQLPHQLAANLRKAFSGIVAGNVKPTGIAAIREYGKFEICGEAALMELLDKLLKAFVAQDRMKMPGTKPYEPCYKVIS
ncbi:MAG: DUF3412 domain-containing protein [Proteobacteria bacterium]|nr:DUF3412 domain-containing protein [Pseudomonadota bacterium]